MKDKEIQRRTFLKVFGGALLGSVLWPVGKWFGANNTPTKRPHLKEAKFYKMGEDLAG